MESILKIAGQGAWNGGTLLDNSIYENMGMTFKNKIPVTGKTIEERIGVRTRMAAPEDERIGVLALRDLLDTSGIDPGRIRMLIGATNVGEDKNDPGPLIQYPLMLLGNRNIQVEALDLYAGCPGFNVAVELVLMLSACGILQKGDVSVIVGAENIHRAKAFRPDDTANIIFGDDALATALETTGHMQPAGVYTAGERVRFPVDGSDVARSAAEAVFQHIGDRKIDGLIIDNQLGRIEYRVPAVAARIQHGWVELTHPREKENGTFGHFKNALGFYDRHVDGFAYDIMSMTDDAAFVEKLAGAYVRSGKYRAVLSGYLSRNGYVELTLHQGEGCRFQAPRSGVVDALTVTHGCFAEYIQAVRSGGAVYGEMDGRGVFLYATRGAKRHLNQLLSPHGLTLKTVDLLIEHQANFAMIPLTIEQVLSENQPELKREVADYVADKMLTNVHTRGNCSVVCMQRLPYDLQRGALEPDAVQGFPVNRSLDQLRRAGVILYDSVGAGMTRSAFLYRVD